MRSRWRAKRYIWVDCGLGGCQRRRGRGVSEAMVSVCAWAWAVSGTKLSVCKVWSGGRHLLPVETGFAGDEIYLQLRGATDSPTEGPGKAPAFPSIGYSGTKTSSFRKQSAETQRKKAVEKVPVGSFRAGECGAKAAFSQFRGWCVSRGYAKEPGKATRRHGDGCLGTLKKILKMGY